MKSTVKGGVRGDRLIVTMDKKVDDLRKAIWRMIFKERKDLSYCDIAMALGLVQYELIHHSDQPK